MEGGVGWWLTGHESQVTDSVCLPPLPLLFPFALHFSPHLFPDLSPPFQMVPCEGWAAQLREVRCGLRTPLNRASPGRCPRHVIS